MAQQKYGVIVRRNDEGEERDKITRKETDGRVQPSSVWPSARFDRHLGPILASLAPFSVRRSSTPRVA